VKLVTKNCEETITGVDIHGRLEALDQSVRSVDGRLRAVERRLSYKSQGKGGEQGTLQEYDIHKEIEELISQVATVAKSVDEIKNSGKVNVLTEIDSKVESMKAELANLVETDRNFKGKLAAFTDAERRLERLENMNKITIGKIKVPLELSGLVAFFVLLVTGYLIFADKWNIIRSSYYPISIGVIFGTVVIAKFLMTNREIG
jgi:hypothetical protein